MTYVARVQRIQKGKPTMTNAARFNDDEIEAAARRLYRPHGDWGQAFQSQVRMHARVVLAEAVSLREYRVLADAFLASYGTAPMSDQSRAALDHAFKIIGESG